MKYGILFLTMILAANLAAQDNSAAQIVRLNELQSYINNPSTKVKVLNFWATWCAPCVKEIPLFEKLSQIRTDVEVTLVSMDLDLDSNPEKVYKFMERKRIQSRVMILNEADPNSWIDQIDKSWSGALPATLIISLTGKRIFIEKELHEGDLEQLINNL